MESVVVAKSVNKDSKDKEKEKKSSSSSKNKDRDVSKEKDRSEKDSKKSSSKSGGSSKQSGGSGGSKSRRSESPVASKRRHRSRSGSSNEDEPIKKSSKSSKKDENLDGGGGGGAGGGGDVSLSIEETNKLRAKLGLKPLTADSDSSASKKPSDPSKPNTYIDKETYEEFEHKPASNLGEQREQKEFRRKLEEQREKRRLLERLEQLKKKEKEEGEEEDDEESADVWLRRIKEREEARKKAALLEEMDRQFEEDDESTTVTRPAHRAPNNKAYSEKNLSGFKVEHDVNYFKEGQQTILTLKDRAIVKGSGENLELDDDEDVLVNVNIADDERAAKNIEARKKRPDYNPYDDFDEDGNFKVKGILEKYNDELNGEQKKYFKLGKGGKYDLSDEKFIAQLNEDQKSRAIKLDATEFKITTDYYTTEEMEKFKKPKKVRKAMRKGRAVKADDLLPLEPQPSETTAAKSAKVAKPETTTTTTDGKVNLKEIDFGLDKSDDKSSDEDEGEVKSEPKSESDNDDDDDDDFLDTSKLNKRREDDEELRKILDEENEELANMLSRTRNRVIAPRVIEIKTEKTEVEEDNGVDFDKLEKTEDDHMVLDTISEFCRNIKSENRDAEDEEEDDDERTSKRVGKKKSDDMDLDDEDEEDRAHQNGNGIKQEAESDEEKSEEEDEPMEKKPLQGEDDNEEEANILDAEPILNRGCMSAILLATNKGYLAESKDSKKTAASSVKASSIKAANYTIEERTYYDIDDKYNRNNRNDRYTSGPLVDFDEKKSYKPDVKLNYFDEKGRAMNEKEAFRYLSHRFHGKGPGKIKTEKRMKKLEEAEAMNKMSSVDTPLNTVALMQEKQKKLQQPFVVLSARKKDQPDHIGK